MMFTAVVGYLATSLVFATFCTKHMVRLRYLAIASNIAFMSYGYLGKLWPILILHAAMMPMNILRFRQAVLLERPDEAAGLRPRADAPKMAKIRFLSSLNFSGNLGRGHSFLKQARMATSETYSRRSSPCSTDRFGGGGICLL